MGERRFENPQTINLQSVLSACAAIHELLADREREAEGERETDTRPGMVGGYAMFTVLLVWCREGRLTFTGLPRPSVSVCSCSGDGCKGLSMWSWTPHRRRRRQCLMASNRYWLVY